MESKAKYEKTKRFLRATFPTHQELKNISDKSIYVKRNAKGRLIVTNHIDRFSFEVGPQEKIVLSFA